MAGSGVSRREFEGTREGKPVPTIRLNGTKVFYVEVGEGIPCLVMHGGLESY